MKKLIFLSAAFAATMLATSCSSSEEPVVETTPQDDISRVFNSDGEAYVNVTLNLPATDGTRAGSENSYDEKTDGLATEYDVKDAVLFIMNATKSTSETEQELHDAATFLGAYKLDTKDLSGVSPEITTRHRSDPVKISKAGKQLTANDRLYAFVVVNGISNGIITEDAGSIVTTGFSGKTISKLLGTTLTAEKIGDTSTKGLLMTNTQFATTAGGSSGTAPSAVTTVMKKLESSNFYTTEQQAKDGGSVDIYVERAAAKVSVYCNVTAAGGNAISELNWQADNTELTFYPYRHITPASYFALNISGKYRFVENAATATGLYRINWAKSPNYATAYDATSTLSNTTTGLSRVTPTFGYTPVATTAKAETNCQYITETTPQELYAAKTARILVRAKFNGGNPFYTVPQLEGANTIYQVGTGTGSIDEYLQKYITETAAYKEWAADKTGTVAISITAPTSPTPGSGNTFTVASVKKGTYDADATLIGKFQAAITNLNIYYYAGGYAYYAALIKHFGDNETPWSAASATGVDYAGTYGMTTGTTALTTDAQNKYLGRYGVVRNNWYQIEIDGIRQIGSATIPSVPTDGTPDDQADYYLSAKIHIVKWAVRTQKETL